MIPLRDNIPSRTTPYVNYTLIAISVGVFLLQLISMGRGIDLIEQFGMVPARVFGGGRVDWVTQPVPGGWGAGLRAGTSALPPAAVPDLLTLLTCIFLHGGWLHLIGNVWFLYVFGDNVEDRLGHWRYLLLYLSWGVAASGVHLMTASESAIPTIGASGAIAGVMGAYFLLYPRAKVTALVPLFVLVWVLVLPAPVFLGVWFLIQLFQGSFALGGSASGGVAWWAHIGGFVAGAGVAWLLVQSGRARPAVVEIRPRTRRIVRYGDVPIRRRRRL